MNSHNTLFCVAIALGLLTATCTGLKKISNPQQLIDLFATGIVVNEDIELKKDLDFQKVNLFFPLGLRLEGEGSCAPYSGVFNGKGHKIKNLVMNNTDENYSGAGLFCHLENATIKDLVIDSSCSFTAESVGALAVMARISLTVSKVTNKANVTGDELVGGLIGGAFAVEHNTLRFEDCVNEGTVSSNTYCGGIIGSLENNAADIEFINCVNRGPISGQSSVGGIVGTIDECLNTTVTFSSNINNENVGGSESVGGFIGRVYDCFNTFVTISGGFNNGNLSGLQQVGGFIGSVVMNENLTLSISTSINNGNVIGESGTTGGFVGSFEKNTGAFATISNVYNHGMVQGSSSDVGGLVGNAVNNIEIELSLINSTNNGLVTGNRYVGGLVGGVSSRYTTSSSKLTIKSSANRGNVSATDSMACGLFCVSLVTNADIVGNVMNSINRGAVRAPTRAFGFTNTLSKAHNVVSMGEITESSESFSFWSASTSAKLFYGLKSNCVNCTGAVLFELNSDTGFYDTVGDGKHVQELLNYQAAKQNYGVEWSSELELLQSFSPSSSAVHFLSPLVLCLAFVAFLSMMF